jgi:ABC-type nitrate/sulfonate/bicarbonate transport system substrate-binding protein
VKDFPFGTIDVSRGWAGANVALAKRFMAAYLKSVAWFYDDRNRDHAVAIMAAASKTSINDNSQSYDYYRQIGFFEKSGTVSKAALKSLVAVLQKTGELKDDLPPEKLVMPGVTEVGP